MIRAGLVGTLTLSVFVGCDQRWSSDRSAAAILTTLVSAQEDFRSNDRNRDGVQNYWVRDVAGLHHLDLGDGPLELVGSNVARADWTSSGSKFVPYAGYGFAALKTYGEGGKSLPYDEGTGLSAARFGMVAFPVEGRHSDGAHGTLTFIVNELGVIYAKNTGGKPVSEFPEDPRANGWKPFDRIGH